MKIIIEHKKEERKEVKNLVKDIKQLNKDFDWGLEISFEFKLK